MFDVYGVVVGLEFYVGGKVEVEFGIDWTASVLIGGGYDGVGQGLDCLSVVVEGWDFDCEAVGVGVFGVDGLEVGDTNKNLDVGLEHAELSGAIYYKLNSTIA